MTSNLPINLTDLLRQRTVEGDRIEYKAGRNPDANGQLVFRRSMYLLISRIRFGASCLDIAT